MRTVIAERSSIKGVEATFSVEFEKDESTMSGDAALEVTDENLNMRIYSLGFLVGEISEENGIIKSKPELGKNKSLILIYGLRNSILWWRIKDYDVAESSGLYHLSNLWQKIFINKKTMLPTYQEIELDNSKKLKIFYEEPRSNGEFWYQSKMRIELSKYVVRLEIKDISFIPHSAQGQRQQPL